MVKRLLGLDRRVKVGAYTLHFTRTKDGSLRIRGWLWRRRLDWFMCLIRHFTKFQRHIRLEWFPIMDAALNGKTGPIRFVEGKARCWMMAGRLQIHHSKWKLSLSPEEVAAVQTMVARLTGETDG